MPSVCLPTEGQPPGPAWPLVTLSWHLGHHLLGDERPRPQLPSPLPCTQQCPAFILHSASGPYLFWDLEEEISLWTLSSNTVLQ